MTMTATLPSCCRRARLAFAISLALGCAGPRSMHRDAGPRPSDPGALEPVGDRRAAVEEAIQAVLDAARATLGQSRPELGGRTLPTDCSGYLRGIYAVAGVDLFSEGLPADNGVRAIVRWVERHGQLHQRKIPAPGDLVFFDNSYDRNGDGRLNDRFTHAGLVEQVAADGTAQIIHATNHGIVREPMNLLHPHDDADALGRPLNAPLRRKSSRDPARTPHLMSELFAGFGTVLPASPRTAGL